MRPFNKSASKRTEYITIPREIPQEAYDLERIGQLIESAKLEYKATHTVADAFADGIAEGEGPDGASAQDLASLVDIRLAGVTRALVVDDGPTAESVISACFAAGLAPCVAYTEDMVGAPCLALAQDSVCIGAARTDAFDDNYRVLSAAEVAGAQAIILVGSRLAQDERFVAMAAEEGRSVFLLDAAVQANGAFGGTTKAWRLCEPPAESEQAAAAADSWIVCPKCRKVADATHVRSNLKVCPDCGHHFRMTSQERIACLVDAGSFEDWSDAWDLAGETPETDPLNFPGYMTKIERMRARSGLSEGVRCGCARIAGMPVAIGIMDSTFFMGSMGSVVGERITRTVERATEERLPLILFCASGGARMQEGLVSLMQMAKVSAAVQRHAEERLPYISVITDPTTGGVTASFAMQGDVIISEPHALIGFAGRRVIQDTIRQELPKEFQTAEFALEHGLIDAIVERSQLRAALANVLALYAPEDVDAPLFGSSALEPEEEGDVVYSYGVGKRLAEVPRGFEAVREALAAHPVEGEGPNAARADEPASQDKSGVLTSAARVAVTAAATIFGRPRRANAWERRKLEQSSKRVAALLAAPVNANAAGQAIQEAAGAAMGGSSAGGTEAAGQAAQANASAACASGQPSEGEASPAWRSVQTARDVHRPTAGVYLDALVNGFFELHGDRGFADDGAIVAGIGWVGRRAVTVVAQEKGRNLQERIQRNFGCPQPEGYRKSLRIMRASEHFGLPVVCLVDTQGAFCGKEAEERGQGNAIADNLFALAGLRVPVVSVLVGEGGSGGALALALADRVAMQEHAVYSVLSPEGFASILWKDRSRAPEAAAVMRMNAYEIFEMGIVDAVLEEGIGSASQNPEFAAAVVKRYVTRQLDALADEPIERLLERRYERFRKF